eukprot:765910-Hanusia_phi.AAC.4
MSPNYLPLGFDDKGMKVRGSDRSICHGKKTPMMWIYFAQNKCDQTGVKRDPRTIFANANNLEMCPLDVLAVLQCITEDWHKLFGGTNQYHRF